MESKKKKIPKSVSEMSKEMLQETLKKKKECNAKALQTVEKLCETEINEEWFLANLQFINQSHFDDVAVERAISKLCGYPLCSKKLEKIPTQQYHISTRYNKVFDITERKNFCSSSCYKSALYVKNQLFTSPLWFRDQEVIPKYTVLKAPKSSMGEEVVFFQDKIQPQPEDIKKKKEVKSDSVKELVEKCVNLVIDSQVKSENVKSDADVLNKENIPNRHVSFSPESVQSKKEEAKPKIKKVEGVAKVEESIFEWFSLDSVFYLYGEEKLKELFSDKANKVKEVLNSRLQLAGSNEKIDKVIQLYGLLDTESFSSVQVKAKLKPLPDYSTLKEEGKTLEVKVRAFYKGQLEVRQTKTEEEKKNEEVTTDDNVVYLPLIDAHAQISVRRKIVLDKLNMLLPDLFKIFNSDYVLEMSEVRNLVSTFSLSAHNVTFKPSEWYLMGIILIRLMSLKDAQLESAMRTAFSQSQTSLILKNFELQDDYLENLVQRLTDTTNLLERLNDINR